jgi:hypothetical protein
MADGKLQQQLFQTIKNKIPDHLNAVDEVAKVLDITSDSTYRRMRGDTNLTLDEIHKLCLYYKISLDQMMDIQTGSFIFQGKILDSKTFRFDAYLTDILNTMAYLSSVKQTEFYYLCKESPIFHHFYFREFAAFKYFFWMRTLLYFPEFRNTKVSFDEYPDEFFNIGKKVLDIYNQIDSVEIWSLESMNTTFKQIEYYRDSQLFHSDRDVLVMYETLERYWTHLEKQAEIGYKFDPNDPDRKRMGSFHMYFNEVVIGDNHMLAIMDGAKIAFIPHSAINTLMTRDVVYCEKFHMYLQNLMRRSTLISEVSEKERSHFFRIIRDRITKRKESLKI